MLSRQLPIRVFFVLPALVMWGAFHLDVARHARADQPPRVVVDPLHGVDPLQGFDPLPEADRPGRQSAVASDLDSASEIAQELLRLQQQLGGSVVTDRAELQGVAIPPAPVTPRPPVLAPPPSAPDSFSQPRFQPPPKWSAYPPHGHPSSDVHDRYSAGRDSARTANPNVEVTELREADWQLVATAHRLEQLDLYDQADALRAVARQLRQDARGRQQAERAAARATLEERATSE